MSTALGTPKSRFFRLALAAALRACFSAFLCSLSWAISCSDSDDDDDDRVVNEAAQPLLPRASLSGALTKATTVRDLEKQATLNIMRNKR